jgi:hypothetical protein
MRFQRAARAVLLACLALTAATAASAADDAVVDAKRRAAAELMRDNKPDDAVAMLLEVVRSDPGEYRDHLQLARAYDKLNRPADAADAFHRAADLLATARVDDRAARTEIDRRLRILDAQTAKVAAAEAEFLKKLDALERDAVAARDMRALRRVFALRGGVWNARGRGEGFGVELPAAAEWVDGGSVQKGVTYRVRAAGYWTINGSVRCDPDGTDQLPATPGGPYGSFHAQVDNGGRYEPLGSDCTFVAPASGRIQFISNAPTRAERERSSGSLYILVTPVAADAGRAR